MGMLIGKIQDVRFGFVGYQDCEYGLYLTLGSDKEHWGVGTCVSGGWSSEPTEHCKWTLEDQSERFAEMSRKVIELLKTAKVQYVPQLKGIPVEVEFDGNLLKDWRILDRDVDDLTLFLLFVAIVILVI